MNAGASLDYGNLMQKAMRGMMAEVLAHVAENGLPGQHHFYISFETGHPGVDIPDWLRDSYPEEMTIVLQDWFQDLAVAQDRFSVTLNFSDQAQTLVIPFGAVRTFVDPSVKFGLKFDPQDPDLSDIPTPADPDDTDGAPDDDGSTAPEEGAQVVSLDQFRKP